MKKLFLSVSLLALVVGAAQTAQAIPLNGAISYRGDLVAPTAPTFVPPATTQIDIFDATVGVLSASGNLALIVTPRPAALNHQPVVIYSPPTFPIDNLFTFGLLEFDLTSFTVTAQDATSLELRGTGVFKYPGEADKVGKWILTANRAGNTASYSASAAIPEPGLLGLLGLGLLGLARSVRSRRQ